jgi:hypothetical protein
MWTPPSSLTGALELFRDLGDQRRPSRDLGVVQRRTGDNPAATASLTVALHLFRDLSDRQGHAWASINLGELLFLSSAYAKPAATSPRRSASPAT